MFNEGYCFEILGLTVWKFNDFPIIVSLGVLFIVGAIYFRILDLITSFVSANELSLHEKMGFSSMRASLLV